MMAESRPLYLRFAYSGRLDTATDLSSLPSFHLLLFHSLDSRPLDGGLQTHPTISIVNSTHHVY